MVDKGLTMAWCSRCQHYFKCADPITADDLESEAYECSCGFNPFIDEDEAEARLREAKTSLAEAAEYIEKDAETPNALAYEARELRHNINDLINEL